MLVLVTPKFPSMSTLYLSWGLGLGVRVGVGLVGVGDPQIPLHVHLVPVAEGRAVGVPLGTLRDEAQLLRCADAGHLPDLDAPVACSGSGLGLGLRLQR